MLHAGAHLLVTALRFSQPHPAPPSPRPHPITQRRYLTRSPADVPALPPVAAGALQLLPPAAFAHQPASSFAMKFAGQAPSKVRLTAPPALGAAISS